MPSDRSVPVKASPPIVEIGNAGLLSRVDPANAMLLWTSEEDLAASAPENVREFGLREFVDLWRRAWRYEIDTIVVHPPTRHPPWHWRPLRSVFHWPPRPWRRFIRLFGIQAIRLLPRRMSVLVVDGDDMRTIPRCNAFLLDRCTFYFKRELPIDRWQVFQRTAHPEMPSTRFRRKPRNRSRLEKLRPWAIGYLSDGPSLPETAFPEKTIGLLVAVATNSSTVRHTGLEELRALAARRKDIFIAEERLRKDEFCRLMSQAWLTWSPEGFGWDCIRHYEAAAVYSVPVINQPTIARFHPLLEGVHALHYDADVPGSLTAVVEAALADPERMRRIATAARAHVNAHHITPWRRAEQLLAYRAGAETPPGGITL